MARSSTSLSTTIRRPRLIRKFIDEQVNEKFLKEHGAQGCGIGRDANGEPCLNLYINKGRPEVEKIVRPKKHSISDHETNQDFDIPIREVALEDFRLDKAPQNGPPLHVAGGDGISADGKPGPWEVGRGTRPTSPGVAFQLSRLGWSGRSPNVWSGNDPPGCCPNLSSATTIRGQRTPRWKAKGRLRHRNRETPATRRPGSP